jgi:hypothetical protein
MVNFGEVNLAINQPEPFGQFMFRLTISRLGISPLKWLRNYPPRTIRRYWRNCRISCHRRCQTSPRTPEMTNPILEVVKEQVGFWNLIITSFFACKGPALSRKKLNLLNLCLEYETFWRRGTVVCNLTYKVWVKSFYRLRLQVLFVVAFLIALKRCSFETWVKFFFFLEIRVCIHSTSFLLRNLRMGQIS